MKQDLPIEEKKSLLRNDRKLVCSMFVFYGLCILGLVAATLWGLDRRSKTISANATSTAFAAATQQTNATATAAVRATEQAQYKVIDRFDANRQGWRTGAEDNEYWSGYTTIQSGVYLWNIKDSKEGFVSWSDFSDNEYLYDFDVYVDTQVKKGEPGKVCSGLVFRKSPYVSRKDEYYCFVLCNNTIAHINYHSDKDGWEEIATIPFFASTSSFSESPDWNQLAISARGSHFTFFINGDKIHEMDDDRRKVGGLALVVEVYEEASARVLFDNFGFQPVKSGE